jgi:hypothetical protein
MPWAPSQISASAGIQNAYVAPALLNLKTQLLKQVLFTFTASMDMPEAYLENKHGDSWG